MTRIKIPMFMSDGTGGLEKVPEALAPSPSASGVAGHKPREQWSFTGRETHWGYTFLVWTRDDGKRFVRWVR